VNLVADLEEFVHDHRSHGTLTGDATAPRGTATLLTVTCPYSVVFERFVTPEDAELDLLEAAFLN
jgi:hypothetical protein